MDEFAASWNAWFAAALQPVCALLIIDVQNDFIDGTLRVPDEDDRVLPALVDPPVPKPNAKAKAKGPARAKAAARAKRG